MAIEGLHHITAITGDAQRALDFYAGTLGLRLVKKTVNFDAPDIYHLYLGDERGTPGSLLTFFEFPRARPGRAGAGMVHRILWRVGHPDALDFWARRLGEHAERVDPRTLSVTGPEGLTHELIVADVPDPPLVADSPGIPTEHALRGLHGVRAYNSRIGRSARALEQLGFTRLGEDDTAWQLAGTERRAVLHYDEPPARGGLQSAGIVHHIAWSVADDAELKALRDRVRETGARPTQIVDRQYFHSVYFHEPSGILFELATRDIGFQIDEPLATLGSRLTLPAQYEADRAQLEETLRPIVDPRPTHA